MKRKHSLVILTLFLAIFLSLNMIEKTHAKSVENTHDIKQLKPLEDTALYEKEIHDRICEIYATRNSVFINKDLNVLPKYFDTSSKYGRWSLEHEVKRVKYLNNWSRARGITFTNSSSQVILKKIYNTKDGVRVGILESYKFDYKYDDDNPVVLNTFGIGLNHTINLIKKNNNWIIYNDWYTDCFEDALKAYNGDIKEITFDENLKIGIKKYIHNSEITNTPRYNRINAVKYADKYCGGANAAGNNFMYNKKYMNFNGIGGDCTNFVSQVLGDKEGGNARFDDTWFCPYIKNRSSIGSKAWVNADSLKKYLIYSGKGRIIKKGTFKELIKATSNFPYGAAGALIPGDVICYVKGNVADHFAVVTAVDSHGYPLVNSHTTDRYHVPWDLGWGDIRITFNLFSIR